MLAKYNGSGKESALTGSSKREHIVQGVRRKRELVTISSVSLQWIFKSSHCLPNRCFIFHIKMLTLTFLSGFRKYLGLYLVSFVSNEY